MSPETPGQPRLLFGWLAIGPTKVIGPVLGIVASTYLAARCLGAESAAIVAGLETAFIGFWCYLVIDELSRSLEEVTRLALMDDLTGLANSRSFHSDLHDYGYTEAGRGEPLSIIVMDIDRFKLYNDTFGHPAGDEAIEVLGRSFAAVSGEAHKVYRVGGDEFALILPRTDNPAALDLADRMRLALEVQIDLLRPITASFGVVTMDAVPGGVILSQLLPFADRALYRAKASGGNRVVHFDDVE